MAEWRERGYVPDSDDEESDEEGRGHLESNKGERHEGESNWKPTNVASTGLGAPSQQQFNDYQPTSTNPPLGQLESTLTNSDSATPQDGAVQGASASQQSSEPSTADKLEAQLIRGLQTCRDVLSSRPGTPALSDLDSPLSSLPSSPGGSASGIEAQRSVQNGRDSRSHSPGAEVEAQTAPSPTMQAAMTGRSFRPRALMQLHPYTIEYAKYHKDWKARGLPPIRTTNAQSDPQAHRQDETQDTDAFQSSQNAEFSSRPSSPVTGAIVVQDEESQNLVQPTRSTQVVEDMGSDDELPDLAEILKARGQRSAAVVSRKRKAREDLQSSTRHKKLPRLDLVADEARDRAMDRELGSRFDMPPSPPRSTRVSSSPSPLFPEDHLDLPLATPRPLPTPVLSSDRQVTKRTTVEVSSSSEQEMDSSRSGAFSTDSEASGAETQGIVQMRKRIKGVLPASWLRLDAQQQKQPSAPRHHTASPEKGGPSKGLAKHMLTGRSLHDEDREIWPDDFGSDGESTDSASDDRMVEAHRSQQPFRIPLDLDDDGLLMDDVIEEDEIDAMMPSGHRASRTVQRPRKKRQRRLDDGWVVDEQSVPRRTSKPGHSRKHSKLLGTFHKSGNKRRKTKQNQRQLTVLDAPGFTMDREEDMPRFLKVAARVQRSGRGPVPQDPKQKFFRLSTWNDTTEINKGLRDWSAGSSSRSRSLGSHARSARLRQNGHSHQRAQSRPHRTKTAKTNADAEAQVRQLTTSTDRTLTRLQQPSATGSAVNNPVSASEADQTLSHRRQLGVFFSHVNRSGSGRLLDPLFARPAQLEAPRVSLRLPNKRIQPPQAEQEPLPTHPARVETSLLPRSGRPPQVSQPRKRKLPPKMAGNTADVDSGPRAGSDFSNPYDDFGETHSEYERLRDEGDSSIGTRYRAWLRQLSDYPLTTIIQHLQGLVSPHLGPYSCSPYISERRFARVLDRLKTRRELLAAGQINELLPPTSTTQRADRVEHLFAEIEQQLQVSMRPDDSQSMELCQLTINNVFEPLELAQSELIDHSWFSDLPVSATIPSTLLDTLDRTMKAWYWFQSLAILPDTPVCSFVISQLLVCAYQVADIATRSNDDRTLQHALSLFEDAANLATGSALLTRAYTWFPNETYEGAGRFLPLNGSHAHTMTSFVDQYHLSLRTLDITYMVDTIIIVYHLTLRQKLPGAKFDFENIMHAHFWAANTAGPIAQPATVVAGLRLIHPLTRLDAAGETFLDTGYNGWQLMSPAMQGFCAATSDTTYRKDFQSRKEHYKKESPVLKMRKDWAQEHSMLMIHCFAFMTVWEWEVPDDLLTSMFAIYAKNDLLDIHVSDQPRATRPPFLDPPQCLELFELENNQSDFATFLLLVAAALRRKMALLASPDASIRQSAANKLATLGFRLLPNSTLPFHRQRKIGVSDYRSLWHHYDLYLTLYANLPVGSRPRVHLFEELVDFGDCPSEIRQLTFDVWKDLVLCAMSRPENREHVGELAAWGRRMLERMIEEYRATDVFPASESDQVRGELLDLRANVSGSVAALLRRWGSVLPDCSKMNARLMLPDGLIPELTTFMSLANKHLSLQRSIPGTYMGFFRHTPRLRYPERIFDRFITHPGSLRYAPHLATMELLATVSAGRHIDDYGFNKKAEDLARDVFSAILSCEGGCSLHDGETCGAFHDVLRAITVSWSRLASENVGLWRSWDEYLTARSPLSFAILSESEYSRHSKVLFMARIIESSPMTFIMDRSTFYATWVEGLLVPEHLMLFEHVLSAEILRYDQSKALLGAVLNRYARKNTDPLIHLDKLKRERLDVIRLLVARIYTLQMDPPVEDDSQLSIEGPISSRELAGLLSVMTDTMKRYWRLLSGESRSTYQSFIQKVLVELESYNFEGFTIDQWFTDVDEPEFPKARSGFGCYFSLPIGAPAKTLSRGMIQAFQTSILDDMLSCQQSKQESWHKEMLQAFACSNEQLSDDGRLKVDECLQVQFLHVVLPAYVEVGVATPAAAPVLAAVVRLLVELVQNAHLRVQEAGDWEEFCEVGLAILRLAGGSEAGSECLEVVRQEGEMRKWTRRELETGLKGIAAVDAEVNGVEEAREAVKGWEEGEGEVVNEMAVLFE